VQPWKESDIFLKLVPHSLKNYKEKNELKISLCPEETYFKNVKYSFNIECIVKAKI